MLGELEPEGVSHYLDSLVKPVSRIDRLLLPGDFLGYIRGWSPEDPFLPLWVMGEFAGLEEVFGRGPEDPADPDGMGAEVGEKAACPLGGIKRDRR